MGWNARILLSVREFLLRPFGRRTVGHFFRRLFHLCPPLKSSTAYYVTECGAIHFNPFSRPVFSACPRPFPPFLSQGNTSRRRTRVGAVARGDTPYLLALSIKSRRGLVQ